MKPKERAEKLQIKLRFAAGLEKALKNSEFDSFRQLALTIGFETSHIQRITTGKVDLTLSSVISLAEVLDISYAELAGYYDSVTDAELQEFIKAIKERKRKTSAKAKSTKGKKSSK